MSVSTFSPSLLGAHKSERVTPSALLWYGGVAVGVLAGGALSTFLWRRRLKAVEATISPLERAEELIANCERKLETIEQSVADLKDLKSDIQAERNADSGRDADANSDISGNLAAQRANARHN